MSTEHNKATVRRHYEMYNKQDFSAWNELMDKDYVTHSASGQDLKGLEAHKRLLATMSPDIQFSIDEMVAEGDIVALRGYFKGTNTVPIAGNPPTGKKFTRAAMGFYRFKNDKIAEAWAIQDMLGFYRQLGITSIPPAAQPAAPAGR